MAPMAENRIRRFSERAIRGLEKVTFEAADPLVLPAALAARADRAQIGEGRSAARWAPHARMPSTPPPVAEDPPRSDSRSRRPPNERARSGGFARPTVHGRRVPLP